MDLSDLFTTYFRFRKNTATPRQMLKIMLYAYMNIIYSSWDIEKACHRDVNFMYLLEDSKAPNHATIAQFRTLHFASISKSQKFQIFFTKSEKYQVIFIVQYK
ncbi:transposase [Lachnotalea glycerini]|uniref:transposase n=1 Tax=Lachnotalea glycerini TaxID=1763509 RepID=UPI000D76EDEA